MTDMTETGICSFSTGVDVCICTFRRSHITSTLRSVAAQELPEGLGLKVIVADNDREPSARQAVNETGREFGLDLSYLHAPAKNISVARNACLDLARSEWIAFLDDDEIASPQWLRSLLEHAHEAHVVFGPVNAVYPENAPPWVRKGNFHSTKAVFVKGRITTGYTCNVLMQRAAIERVGARFDLAYGVSGGEDTLFFGRLSDAGLRFAFAPAAIVEEETPAHRTTLSWLAKRRFRSGQSHGAMLLARKQKLWLPHAITAAVKMGICFAGILLTVWSPLRWRRWLLRGLVHAGVTLRSIGLKLA
jgi:succinoglycan biosynthesis protein ExoM